MLIIWYQSGALDIVERVTTRLQKEVSQLQKDVAKIEFKIDGVTDQMIVEVKLELEREMINVQKELNLKEIATVITRKEAVVVDFEVSNSNGESAVSLDLTLGRASLIVQSLMDMILWDEGSRLNNF